MENMFLGVLIVKAIAGLFLLIIGLLTLWHGIQMVRFGRTKKEQKIEMELGPFKANALGSSVLLLLTSLPILWLGTNILPKATYTGNPGYVGEAKDTPQPTENPFNISAMMMQPAANSTLTQCRGLLYQQGVVDIQASRLQGYDLYKKHEGPQ